ncbi:MAG: hypothetical protein JSR82_08200 [Verrucomicrobia bacterium]|nr:hypothetical protein [Verrucomicrobiota bacterium]
MSDPRPNEGEGGVRTGLLARWRPMGLARRPGNPSRHDRILRELAPACDSIDRADFLSGIRVEPFLRLADGARRG